MSRRLIENTRWLWCLLAFSGPWKLSGSVAVRSPPNNPQTIEAQAKFFQDFFSVQLSPYKMEFGHVCEDPNTWEQRYERKDFKNHRDMGKVRWGDKQGGYGEHYWDLNHAGHADQHGDDGDDGSYSRHDNEDPYDEPSEQQHTYDDTYNPEQAINFDDSNRAKRHHPKIKTETKDDVEVVKTSRHKAKDETVEEVKTSRRKAREESKKAKEIEKKKQEEETFNPIRYKPKELNYEEEEQNPNVPTQTSFGGNSGQPQTHAYQPDNHYVPYEGGAGVRQRLEAQVTAASTPRLFLEPSTGHVVDRATGQAYILQPVAINYQ